jgi:serine/threonine protein kinase/Tol biopolymer transport system component
MIGKTILHYKILEELGRGGMGEVYKAEDAKLNRMVALKFLSKNLLTSEENKARFIQEAKTASALNHPNVCTIHDIQEHDGQQYIVMEYVDGQTLRDHKRPLSIKQVADIGTQVAEGLAAAHSQGIVHRDIKPDNIMVRKDGIVQIMDFGLAKLRGGSTLTKEGSTVGTLAYMPPEQLQGDEVDARSDIFSLGAVLYELVSGHLPFKGEYESAIIYEIINSYPEPISMFRDEIEPELEAIIMECLEKDPNERYQSAKELAKNLKRFRRDSSRQRISRTSGTYNIQQGPSPVQEIGAQTYVKDAPKGQNKRERIAWASAILFLIAFISIAYFYFTTPEPDRRTIRASILSPTQADFAYGVSGRTGGHIAISPDGTKLAFVAADSLGKNHLWVQPLNALSGQQLTGTEGAYYPFWSADSRFIGFFTEGKLKKINTAGGPPVTICDASQGRGGTWNLEDNIVFAPDYNGEIYMVPAGGGDPQMITKLDSGLNHQTHRWPCFLPDGKHFFYFARTSAGAKSENDAIYVASLDGKINKSLLIARSNIAYALDYLIYIRENTLMAQHFDENKLALDGDAVPIAEDLNYSDGFSRGVFSLSQNGMLIYQSGNSAAGRKLLWFDRTGKEIGTIGQADDYHQASYPSPDRKKIAIAIFDAPSRNRDIWILDLKRNTRTRFTFDATNDNDPIWSPDGSQIIFASSRKGKFDLYQKNSSGVGSEKLVLASDRNKIPIDWSSDGQFITYNAEGNTKTKTDLWILPLTSQKTGKSLEPKSFVVTEFNEGWARFSPDGKWIAHESDESGTWEVYIRPFPGPGGKWQISAKGGEYVYWRGDGKELYYQSSDNKVKATEIGISGSAIEVGAEKTLFDLPGGSASSITGVSPDGQKFLINVPVVEQSKAPLSLVTNWDTGLKK